MNKLKIGEQTVFARFGLLRLCHVGFGRFMRQNQKINALNSCPLAQKIEHQTKIIICTIYEKKIMKFFLSPASRDASDERKNTQNCGHIWMQVENELVKHFHSGIIFSSCIRAANVLQSCLCLFSRGTPFFYLTLSLSLLFPLNIVYCSLSAIVLYMYM